MDNMLCGSRNALWVTKLIIDSANPKKSLDLKSHAEFLSPENFQEALNDIT